MTPEELASTLWVLTAITFAAGIVVIFQTVFIVFLLKWNRELRDALKESGFFALLTDDQRKAALAYDGDDFH